MRAYAAVQDWNLILELGIQPGPLYFLLTGLLWAFTGLIGGLGLLTGWYHSERLGYFCTSLLLISYWADRFLASRVGTLPPNGAFAAAISAAGLALALLALSRPNARRYLNRMSRRKVVYDQRTGN